MSVKKKPLVVVTRKLPDSIETRMRELFDARLNLDDTPMTEEQIAEAVCAAAKTGGGILGIGGKHISEIEAEFLSNLEASLAPEIDPVADQS